MKIKNKMMLAMDNLIKETKENDGMPASILFEPQEAADFLKEIRELKVQCKKHVSVKHKDDNAIDVRFLLNAPLTKERLEDLIKQWYVRDFVLFYKDIEIRVIKKEAPDVPKPPTPPLSRIIREGSIGTCEKCGSSLHRKFFIWVDGCYQPECSFYYKDND